MGFTKKLISGWEANTFYVNPFKVPKRPASNVVQ